MFAGWLGATPSTAGIAFTSSPSVGSGATKRSAAMLESGSCGRTSKGASRVRRQPLDHGVEILVSVDALGIEALAKGTLDQCELGGASGETNAFDVGGLHPCPLERAVECAEQRFV